MLLLLLLPCYYYYFCITIINRRLHDGEKLFGAECKWVETSLEREERTHDAHTIHGNGIYGIVDGGGVAHSLSELETYLQIVIRLDYAFQTKEQQLKQQQQPAGCGHKF